MSDVTAQRPAPRLPASRGSLAHAAAASPVSRWGDILQEALDTVTHAQDAHTAAFNAGDPGLASTLRSAEALAESMTSPLQGAVLSQRPASLRDAVMMLAVAHELVEDVPHTIEREHPLLGRDVAALHLAIGALLSFFEDQATDHALSDMPEYFAAAVARARKRTDARFLRPDAA